MREPSFNETHSLSGFDPVFLACFTGNGNGKENGTIVAVEDGWVLVAQSIRKKRNENKLRH